MTLSKREKLISKGRTAFVIRRGVIDWGITTAVLFTLFTSVLDHGFTADHLLSYEFIIEVVTSFVIFPLSGILFGIIMWNFLNRPEKT